MRQFLYHFGVDVEIICRGSLLPTDITHAAVSKYYRKKAGLAKLKAKSGAATLIQRFGGSLNLNVHFHQLFIDGSYELGPQNEPIDFIAIAQPTLPELGQVLTQIIKRLTKYLERQKIIITATCDSCTALHAVAKDNDQHFQLNISEEVTFLKLQASSATYRFATGPSKGKKAMVLRSIQDGDHNANQGW